ncbi:MAG: hypothetical protein ABJL99_12725 [Aliishimia sp.]
MKPGWGFLPRLLRPLDDLEMEVRARDAIDRLLVRISQSVRAKVGGLSGGQPFGPNPLSPGLPPKYQHSDKAKEGEILT